ncbi:MAG TPA: DegQ family serine endoprotease [Steroidobacteraceae bacterium]|nr:DegQ family serine endoprotease [Steroidobacteraceae bacterium]
MTFSRSARGAVFAVIAMVAAGSLPAVSMAQAASRSAEPPAVTMPDFSGLVERYGPAVVNVEVVERPQAGGRGGPDADDPLNDFFRRFGIPNQGGQPRNAPPAHGTGSGFIISPDGYILTNAHVVSSAATVTVKLTDRREYQAKVVGQDERTDVAVIKIDAQNLPVVKIGDPRQLKPGQWVVAIGSPFGFDNTATAGIVSATARELTGEGNNYVPFIQTDVAVNPGNSGGPLFNTRGEVVGINSQIFSQTGSYMGLSFAIPIDIAVNVENQIIKTGHVVRGRIGVQIQDVNAAFAESFGLGRPRGALVSLVEPGGPADKAGIKPGDVILAVNGQNIDHFGELSLTVSNLHPGSDARLSVWRGGKAQDLTVKIAQVNEDQEKTAANHSSKGPSSGQAERFGLTVRSLTADEKSQAQTDGALVVENVAGPAAAAGIQPGDIILGINGKPIHSTTELQAASKGAGKTVALLIQRQDQQIFYPLRLN